MLVEHMWILHWQHYDSKIDQLGLPQNNSLELDGPIGECFRATTHLHVESILRVKLAASRDSAGRGER